jgi:hypothetical protein
MGFFDNFKEKTMDLMQAGMDQSKRLAEIAKLKTANMSEEDVIKKAHIELGKLYYAERGNAPEGAYAAACERITAARAAIEANNDRIAELKESDGEDNVVWEETPTEETEAKPAEDTATDATAEKDAEASATEEAPAADQTETKE